MTIKKGSRVMANQNLPGSDITKGTVCIVHELYSSLSGPAAILSDLDGKWRISTSLSFWVEKFEEGDEVIATKDFPGPSIKAGCIGTVIKVVEDDVGAVLTVSVNGVTNSVTAVASYWERNLPDPNQINDGDEVVAISVFPTAGFSVGMEGTVGHIRECEGVVLANILLKNIGKVVTSPLHCWKKKGSTMPSKQAADEDNQAGTWYFVYTSANPFLYTNEKNEIVNIENKLVPIEYLPAGLLIKEGNVEDNDGKITDKFGTPYTVVQSPYQFLNATNNAAHKGKTKPVLFKQNIDSMMPRTKMEAVIDHYQISQGMDFTPNQTFMYQPQQHVPQANIYGAQMPTLQRPMMVPDNTMLGWSHQRVCLAEQAIQMPDGDLLTLTSLPVAPYKMYINNAGIVVNENNNQIPEVPLAPGHRSNCKLYRGMFGQPVTIHGLPVQIDNTNTITQKLHELDGTLVVGGSRLNPPPWMTVQQQAPVGFVPKFITTRGELINHLGQFVDGNGVVTNQPVMAGQAIQRPGNIQPMQQYTQPRMQFMNPRFFGQVPDNSDRFNPLPQTYQQAFQAVDNWAERAVMFVHGGIVPGQTQEQIDVHGQPTRQAQKDVHNADKVKECKADQALLKEAMTGPMTIKLLATPFHSPTGLMQQVEPPTFTAINPATGQTYMCYTTLLSRQEAEAAGVCGTVINKDAPKNLTRRFLGAIIQNQQEIIKKSKAVLGMATVSLNALPQEKDKL